MPIATTLTWRLVFNVSDSNSRCTRWELEARCNRRRETTLGGAAISGVGVVEHVALLGQPVLAVSVDTVRATLHSRAPLALKWRIISSNKYRNTIFGTYIKSNEGSRARSTVLEHGAGLKGAQIDDSRVLNVILGELHSVILVNGLLAND